MKWQFIPQANPASRQAALRRGQRRRGRARHLPRPAADDERPALDDRGHHHRLLRGAGRARVRLHPRRGRARHPPGRRRGATRPRGQGLPRHGHPRHAASTARSPCTPAPAPTSAARRRRCSTRSRAGAASRGSSRRSRRPTASTTRRPSSTTSARWRACRTSCWAAPTGTRRSGPRARPARPSTRCPAGSTNPGQYEAPMGTTLRELIELAGGMSRGKDLKFWTPGGASVPAAHHRAPRPAARLRRRRQGRLDERHVGGADLRRGRLRRARGEEVVGVLPSTSRAASARRAARAPTGTSASTSGSRTAQGTEEDLDTLLDLSDNILGRSFCALGDGATSSVSSSIKYFRDEYLAHVESHGCPFTARALAGAHWHGAHST